MLDVLVARVRAAFRERFGGSPRVIAQAPGRVNIIGEHVDYTEGLAMPAAIDRHVVVALRPARGVRVVSLDFDDVLDGAPGGGWQRYVGGVIELFGQVEPAFEGCEAVIAGDVPIGSGLSSSAAIEVALANALRGALDTALGDLDLALICQRVEHEFLGVKSGLLDQLGSQLSRPGHVLFVDFRDLSRTLVPARIEGAAWAVVDTGVRRQLACSAYAERVEQCASGLASLPADHYRDVTEDMLDPRDLRHRRLRHMVRENARVRAARRCFEAGDAPMLGALLLASHTSLRDDYEVSCQELDRLVDLALEQPACLGARMVGGGFGGCTLNLVTEEAVDSFVSAMGEHGPVHRFALVGGAGLVPQ